MLSGVTGLRDGRPLLALAGKVICWGWQPVGDLVLAADADADHQSGR